LSLTTRLIEKALWNSATPSLSSAECSKLKWENVDLIRRTIILNETEKNGNPRIFSISDTLVNMLTRMPKKSEYVFGTCSKAVRSSVLYAERKTIAHKLGNPRILKTGLHTFRH
jgi:integrase